MEKRSSKSACPCGGGLFAECCGKFIYQHAIPQTAEALMRSRYTAYVLREEGYLKATWYGSSRPTEPLFENDHGFKWIGLTVCNHEQDENWATVEFIARYKANGRAHRLHEISRFTRENGRWFYLDGQFPEENQK